MSRDTKKMFRFFTIADFEEEEVFLREQHNQGWKFIKYILPGFYIFKKCEPEDVVYRLDFADVKCGEEESYRQMFRDEGWEYLCDVNGFTYFRKSNCADEEPNIFSDVESKLELIERVQKRRMLPLICIFLCCVVPQLSRTAHNPKGYEGIFVFWIIMLVLYSWLFIHCGTKLKYLKEKYQR